MEIVAAVNQAVDECIRNGILAEILSANRAEVLNLVLTEYDEQSHIAGEKEVSYAEGMEQINKLIQCLIRDGRMDDVIRGTADLDYQKTLLQEYQL